MKPYLIAILLVLYSCGNVINNRNSLAEEKSIFVDSMANLSNSLMDSLIPSKIMTYSDTFSGPFIRPNYYSESDESLVNSWPAEADSGGTYSAKIDCIGANIKNVTIYDNEEQVFQELKMKDRQYECDRDFEIIFVDMNFDGYVDLKVNLERGATGNSWDEYWLFNSMKNKFEYNSLLSQLISARAYPREKKIEAYYRSGVDYQSLENWEWEGEKLKLVNQEIINIEDNEFIHQVFEIVKGKMVRTKADNERFNIRD